VVATPEEAFAAVDAILSRTAGVLEWVDGLAPAG
jgi:hypothetical protein